MKRPGTIERRGHKHALRFTDEHTGNRIRVKLGDVTPIQARQALDKARGLLGDGLSVFELQREFGDGPSGRRTSRGNTRFCDVAADFLKARATKYKPKSLRSMRAKLAVVCGWSEKRRAEPAEWATWPLNVIRPCHIADYFESRREHVTDRTLNRHRNAVARVFQWGVERGYVDVNAALSTSRYKEPSLRRQRRLTPRQASHVIDGAGQPFGKPDPDFADLVLGAMYSGMRHDELRTLLWTDVNLDTREVCLREEEWKTDSRAKPIVVMNVFVALLRRRSETRESEFVFTDAKGRQWRDYQIHERWSGQVRRKNPRYTLGAWPQAVELIKADPECEDLPREWARNFVFHDLRRVLPSWMRSKGCSLEDAGGVLGHTHASMTENYASLDMSDQHRIMEEFEAKMAWADRRLS